MSTRVSLPLIVLLVVTVACSPSRPVTHRETAPSVSKAAKLVAWPEDPCAVLTPPEVAAATGLRVTEARRTASVAKVVQAQSEGRAAGPGTLICSYETRSDVGALMIIAPPHDERTAASYRAAREAYFASYPGSARSIAGLGEDAWIGGGAALRVLVRDGLWFAVATQMAGERSPEILVALARAVLARL